MRRKRRKVEFRPGREYFCIEERKDGTFSMDAFYKTALGVNVAWHASGLPTWYEALRCLRAAWPECPL